MKFVIQHPHDGEISGVVTYVNLTAEILEDLYGVNCVEVVSSKSASLVKRIRSVISADCVLLNSNDLAMALAARLVRKPVSIKYHFPFWLSTIYSYQPKRLHRRLAAEFEAIRRTQSGPARVVRAWSRLALRLFVYALVPIRVGVSEFIAASIGLPGRVHCVPNPYVFAERTPTRSHGDKRRATFTYVGRLSREKGVDLLVEAAARLRELSSDQFRVEIAGSGPAEAELYAQADRSGLIGDGTVQFLGRLDPTEVTELLGRSTVLVVPSRWQDPAPYTLVEASAKAIPSVAALVGGVRSTVGESAYFFAPDNVNSLVNELRTCLADGDSVEYRGRKAFEYASSRFDAKKVVAELVALTTARRSISSIIGAGGI